MNVDAFIEAENGSGSGINVKRACALLEVSRSAYYARRQVRHGTPRQRHGWSRMPS